MIADSISNTTIGFSYIHCVTVSIQKHVNTSFSIKKTLPIIFIIWNKFLQVPHYLRGLISVVSISIVSIMTIFLVVALPVIWTKVGKNFIQFGNGSFLGIGGFPSLDLVYGCE